MMNRIFEESEKLVDMELSLAQHNRGMFFHSPAEGLGVIMEEVDEAIEALSYIDKYFEDLKKAIYADYEDDAVDISYKLERAAQELMCEACQVAAMARKYHESFREIEEVEDE